MNDPTSTYACPRCHGPLAREGERLLCRCGEAYPLEGGVPRFNRSAPVETPELTERLGRMVDQMGRIGWRAALGSSSDAVYLTSASRTRYLELLPLAPTTRVLEVGCSLGQGTSALARSAGTVDAVEVVPGQARFTAERMRQEGLTNVRVCVAGDDCRLPFAGERFDVAVLNLVLEWCGERGESAPERSQRRLLGEVARTLKPGGTIFVATKNRFGVRYLTGGRDEHAGGLRFGNALPRAALALAMRARGPVHPRGTLHSYGALERMIVGAGFEAPRSYWAAPDARFPVAYVPTDAASVRAARAALPADALGDSRRLRLLMRIVPDALVKHVAPGLVFTAMRSARTAA